MGIWWGYSHPFQRTFWVVPVNGKAIQNSICPDAAVRGFQSADWLPGSGAPGEEVGRPRLVPFRGGRTTRITSFGSPPAWNRVSAWDRLPLWIASSLGSCSRFGSPPAWDRVPAWNRVSAWDRLPRPPRSIYPVAAILRRRQPAKVSVLIHILAQYKIILF